MHCRSHFGLSRKQDAMPCVDNSVPCKFFAAGGCRAPPGKCKEYVGERDERNYVLKTHNEFDGKMVEEMWLGEQLPQIPTLPEDVARPYRWAVVVDVEGKPDIVEFPAIVIDFEKSSEVRFHRWVRPKSLMDEAKFINEESNAVDFEQAMREFGSMLSDAGVAQEEAYVYSNSVLERTFVLTFRKPLSRKFKILSAKSQEIL